MPPRDRTLCIDDILVPVYLATDEVDPALQQWKRDHPDWFVAGTWTAPPRSRRENGMIGSRNRFGGMPPESEVRPPTGDNAPTSGPLRLTDPSTLSVTEYMAIGAASRDKRATAATTIAAETSPASDAIPMTTGLDTPVIGGNGQPVQRPAAGLPPSFFVSRGEADRKLHESMLHINNTDIAFEAYRASVLARFRQGGSWDQQRLSGKFDDRFIDYATITIGLYAAASGIPISEILSIQNGYARLFSRFSTGAEMDKQYTSLAKRNVRNTQEGYRLYHQGAIAAKPSQ